MPIRSRPNKVCNCSSKCWWISLAAISVLLVLCTVFPDNENLSNILKNTASAFQVCFTRASLRNPGKVAFYRSTPQVGSCKPRHTAWLPTITAYSTTSVTPETVTASATKKPTHSALSFHHSRAVCQPLSLSPCYQLAALFVLLI